MCKSVCSQLELKHNTTTVPYDQWLVTHVDSSWKAKQVKLWILSKCLSVSPVTRPNRGRSPSPITFASEQDPRPISPITFAPSHPDAFDIAVSNDGYDEDDEDTGSDQPFRARRRDWANPLATSPTQAGQTAESNPQRAGPQPPASDPNLCDRYTLIRFV